MLAPSTFGVGRIAATLAMLMVVAVTLSLGRWQSNKAGRREAAAVQADAAAHSAPIDVGATSLAPEALVGQRVVARGEAVPGATILIDNRTRDGRPGFDVMSAVRLDGHRAVMVDRGFVEVPPQARATTAAPPLAPGPIELEGTALAHPPRSLELGRSDHVLGGLWPNYSREDVERLTGVELLPITIQQTGDSGDGLDRHWPDPGFGAEQNRSYALQWYTMAGVAVLAWLALVAVPWLRARGGAANRRQSGS